MDLTPNQVVAQNLKRARQLRGLTQSEATEWINLHLDRKWCAQTFSIAERSADAEKMQRQFTANEIVAFAKAFELPVAWFFLKEIDPVELQEMMTFVRATDDLREVAGAYVKWQRLHQFR